MQVMSVIIMSDNVICLGISIAAVLIHTLDIFHNNCLLCLSADND